MNDTPTGKRRVRVQTRWFRKPLLVVQVEVTVHDMEVFGPEIRPYSYTAWRDARVEDFSEESLGL